MFKTVTLSKLNFIFYEKFKKKEKEAGTNFFLLSQWKNLIGRFKKFICIDQSRINKTPPGSLVAHIAGNFLIFYSCSYYSFIIRRNNKKVDSVETWRTIIAHLFSWSDEENCSTLPLLTNDDKMLSLLLSYEYNLTCSLVWMT